MKDKQSDRPTRFELHIRPLIRTIDRDHMLFQFDLFDINTFYDVNGEPKTDFINEMTKYLTGKSTPQMPTVDSGGPWPQEFIDIWNRWVSEGCPRLQSTQAQYIAQRLGPNVVRLSAEVQVPSVNSISWIERVPTSPEYWTYKLFTDCLEHCQEGESTSQIISEQIANVPESVTSIEIMDAAGQHSVPID